MNLISNNPTVKHFLTRITALATLATLALPLRAEEFTVSKGESGAQSLAIVESVADFETFTGRTAEVTGKLDVDFQKNTGTGYIEVNAASIDTGIPLRNEHMRSAQWLDTEKNPTIRFETTKVQRKGGDNFAITGKFTLHGVTRTITVPARIRHIRASETTRKAGFKGDVLHIKTEFNVRLSEYNIRFPEQAVGKVSNNVKISLTAFASTGKA